MRIGLDATILPPQPVGVGNYVIHLIRNLAALETEHQFVVFVQRSGWGLFTESDNHGIEWVIVPNMKPARRLLWEQLAMPRLAKQTGIHLLHSLHYTKPLILPCKSVVTFHDLTFFLYPHLHTRFKRLFFPFAIRLSAKQADALIAISENTRQDALHILALPSQKIYTVPEGVSEKYCPIAEPNIRAEISRRYDLPEEFILYVGTLEPRKNLPLLIGAYHHLVKEGFPHSLVIVGQRGWITDPIFRQVETLGLKDKVIFKGYISSEDLPGVYNLAEIFVYPSLYEGFGLPPLEAMACGVPVITTGISAMLEHVGDAGMLVPPQDEQSLTDAMRTLLSDRPLREQLSLKGRQRASQFTWKRTAQETLKVYQTVLTSP